jgi:hypothetical protein
MAHHSPEGESANVPQSAFSSRDGRRFPVINVDQSMRPGSEESLAQQATTRLARNSLQPSRRSNQDLASAVCILLYDFTDF